MTAAAQSVLTDKQPASLARFRAERRAEEIRANLKGAAAMLREARENGDAEVLGYDSHGAYVVDRFGDVLADIRMETEDRRAVVDAMRTAGASHRQIVRELRVSAGTVANDIKITGDHAPDMVVGDDGRTRAARATQGLVAGGDGTPGAATTQAPTVADRTVARVAAAGPSGLTVRELCKKEKWHHGQASGALSRVHRQGRVARSTVYRDGCAAYVVVPTA